MPIQVDRGRQIHKALLVQVTRLLRLLGVLTAPPALSERQARSRVGRVWPCQAPREEARRRQISPGGCARAYDMFRGAQEEGPPVGWGAQASFPPL